MRDIRAEAIAIIAQIRSQQDWTTKKNRIKGLKEFEDVVIKDTSTTEDIYNAAVRARDLVNNASRWSFGILGRDGSVYLSLLNKFIREEDEHRAQLQDEINRIAIQTLAAELMPKNERKNTIVESTPRRLIREEEVAEQLGHLRSVMQGLNDLIETYPNSHLHNTVHQEFKKVSNFEESPNKFNEEIFLKKAKESAPRLKFHQFFNLQKYVREYNSLCEDNLLMAYYDQEVHSNRRSRVSNDKFDHCIHNAHEDISVKLRNVSLNV